MDIDSITTLVVAIAGGLAAILTALIPIVNAKYRKPLQQAKLGIMGISSVTTIATERLKIHLTAYSKALADGQTPPVILSDMATEIAKSIAGLP